MLSIALVVGLWATNCTMTQSNTNQGYARDSYKIERDGSFEYKRTWYVDPICSVEKDVESEVGTLELGKKLNSMFTSGETYEANFMDAAGTDLGAVRKNMNSIQVARGMKNSTMRNTMVGFIEFIKQ